MLSQEPLFWCLHRLACLRKYPDVLNLSSPTSTQKVLVFLVKHYTINHNLYIICFSAICKCVFKHNQTEKPVKLAMGLPPAEQLTCKRWWNTIFYAILTAHVPSLIVTWQYCASQILILTAIVIWTLSVFVKLSSTCGQDHMHGRLMERTS